MPSGIEIMKIMICLLLLTLALMPLTAAECPEHCQCSKYRMRCSGARLQGLPNSTTNTTEELMIMRDNITRLSEKLFLEAGYMKLDALYLDSTNTTNIDYGTFDHMYHLKTLTITHNRIYNIPFGAFKNLQNLSKLSLSNNRLSFLYSPMFEGLEISDLDLSYNVIVMLPHNLFFGMRHINNCKQTADLSQILLPLHTLQAQNVLNFSHNLIDFIRPGTFQGLCGFTALDFSSNKLRTLTPDIFVGLTELRSLDLRINEFTILHTHSFSGFINVKQIKLTSFTSTYIHRDGKSLSDLLRQGFNLGELLPFLTEGVEKHFLEGPGLDFIEEGVFKNLSLLHDLQLCTNCIRNISYKMLQGLSSVRTLSLNQTCIQMLKPDTFKDLFNLHDLDLSVNRIEVLVNGTFRGLKNLRMLNMLYNKIHTIQPEAFSDLSHLKSLDMFGNNISELIKGMFRGLVMLTALNLGSNKIITIEAEAFRDLSFLKYLYLAINKLTSISNEMFHTLGRLTYLDLTRNDELAMEPGTLGDLQVMKIVGVSLRNGTNLTGGVGTILQGLLQGVQSVQELKVTGLKVVLPPEAFVGLNLSALDLSNNYMPLLQNDTFSGLSSLRILKLKGSKLQIISAGAFRELHDLTLLSLDNNYIVELPQGAFQGLNRLETLHLYSNRLFNLKEGIFGSICKRDMNHLQCRSYSINLSEESGHNSSCDVLISLRNLKHLDLSANRIRSIHQNTFICNVQLMTLILNFNLMLSLESNFLFITSLRELELLHCNITELSNDTFKWTPELSKLSLERNKIRTVDVESLKQLKRLEKLYIHDNPLECDCQLQETWYWLKNHHIVYHDATFCLDDRRLDVAMSELECNISHVITDNMVTTDELQYFKEYVEPCILGMVSLIGVIENSFLLFIFIRHPEMRSGPNIYILNLTISDLLNLVVNLPLSYWDILHGSWELGLTMCRVFMGMRDLTVGVTVFCVVALSIQRYCVIVRSFTKHRGVCGLSEEKATLLSVLLVWGLALGFSLPAFLTATVERRCFYSPYGVEYIQRTWVIQLIVYCVVPVLVIALLYVRTAFHLKESVRNMPGERQETCQAQGRYRVANMVVILTVVFSLSYIPNFVLRVLSVWSVFDIKSTTYYFICFTSFCLFFLNSCFNPLALIYMSTAFKNIFFRYICCGATIESPNQGNHQQEMNAPAVAKSLKQR